MSESKPLFGAFFSDLLGTPVSGPLNWALEGLTLTNGNVLLLRVCVPDPSSLPTSDELLDWERNLASGLGLKRVQFCLEWECLPKLELCQEAFIRLRQWLHSHITSASNQQLPAFATLPLQKTEMGVAFLLPPRGEQLLRVEQLRSVEPFAECLLGFRLPLTVAVADVGALEKQIRVQVDSQMSASSPLLSVTDFESTSMQTSVSQTQPVQKSQASYRRKKVEGQIWGRWSAGLQTMQLNDLDSESGLAQFEGFLVNLETRSISNNQRTLLKFAVQSDTGAISCVAFLKPEESRIFTDLYDNVGYAAFQADITFDGRFSKDLQAQIRGVCQATPPAPRVDQALNKRVELHCHSKMSTKDALSDPAAIVRLAAELGQPAVAITDHGVVQGFPEAFEAAQACARKGKPIHLILGMEGYLIQDTQEAHATKEQPVVFGLNLPRGEEGLLCPEEANTPTDRFVAIDVETTGLNPAENRVIELAAARFVRQSSGAFEVVETFQCFLNPGCVLPAEVVQLTGITQDQIEREGRPPLEGLRAFLEFVSTDPVCAHNALFDLGFIRYEGFRVEPIEAPHLKFNPILVDTLNLSRLLWPDCQKFSLDRVCSYLQIPLKQHHRALDDAQACGKILARALQREPELTWNAINERAGCISTDRLMQQKLERFHIILLASDLLGLYHLYRLVSVSHTQFFKKRPCIPKSLLQYWRQGLLLGSACAAGEVFQHLLRWYDSGGKPEEQEAFFRLPQNRRLAQFYDYLEIQPLCNNLYLTQREDHPLNQQDLQNLNLAILRWGDAVKRPVVATCDAHYLRKEDGLFRRILLSGNGFALRDEEPDLYFRTTEEMLEACSYLPQDRIEEICIYNPQRIANRVEKAIRPFPDGTFPPRIDSAAQEIETLTWETAHRLYACDGKLPELVEKRTRRELDSIIQNGFAIMYYIAHKLVKQSNDDGYIVGSRGSVGSSLVATFCGITEVNPLPPHYRCPECRFSQFDESGAYGSGFDLPPMVCPLCGTPLIRDGQEIPFETFLGFDGDKQPDIDLNFSGIYQPQAHQFILEMFGASHTFRAGTISSYAEKNALAEVRKYQEANTVQWNRAEELRLATGIIGVKRTTGQHPGGLVVIPKDREIFDFTPIQYPADKMDSAMTTTHFDFNSMHDTILKLDVLGHDDPTMLKFLSDQTGISVQSIPIPDDKVMQLFTSTQAIGIRDEESPTQSATLGLPEMGTFMARGMIQETAPTRFYDLVQLMGLSHGTDVWKGNAQELIRSGTCTINEVIGCRDSIMTTLLHAGLPPKSAFDIMEKVRKGKGLTEEHEALMRQHSVPEWYIDSCKKIKYMFPKAHAAAYAISALRIAWFKVYHPEAYYSAYFTVRADVFDSNLLCREPEEVRKVKKRLYQSFHDRDGKDKDQRLYYIAELVEEMQLRGIHFLPVDVYRSDPVAFRPEGKGFVRPSLQSIPGISSTLAFQIARAREEGKFLSEDELMKRAEIGPSAIQALRESGCLGDLPATTQMDLFDWI